MDLDTLYDGCLGAGGIVDLNLSLILSSIVSCLKNDFDGCASSGGTGDGDAEDPLGEDGGWDPDDGAGGGICPPSASAVPAPAGC